MLYVYLFTNKYKLKTVSVILQRIALMNWNLYLIKNVEDIVVFIGLKMFDSYLFSAVGNTQVTSEENSQSKIIIYRIHTLSDKPFKVIDIFSLENTWN